MGRDDAMLKDNSTNLDSINKTDFRHIIPLEKICTFKNKRSVNICDDLSNTLLILLRNAKHF